MSAHGYLLKRRRATVIALMCIAMLVAGYFTAFFVVSFQKPVLLSLPDEAAHAIAFKVVAASEVVGQYSIGRIRDFSFLSEPETYFGDYECVARYGARLFVFKGGEFSEYADGLRVRAGRAPEGMEIMAGHEVAVMPAAHGGINWQKVPASDPQAPLMSVLLCIARTARSEFELAAFDGEHWHVCAKSVKRSAGVDMFRMTRIRTGLLVAWREHEGDVAADADSLRGPIFCSVFADGEWGPVLPVETRSIREFALTPQGDGVWYFYPDVKLRDGRQINMVFKRQKADGSFGESGRLLFFDEGRLMRYLSGFAALAESDRITFVFTMTGIVAVAVVPCELLGRNQVWVLRDVSGLPAARNLLAWVWGGAIFFMAAALVLLGFSLLVERIRALGKPPLHLLVYSVARWHRRAAAHAVDIGLVVLPLMAALTVLIGVGIEETGKVEWWISYAIAHSLFVAYGVFAELKWSCTIGKRMLRVMVVSASNEKIAARQAVCRNLVRLIDGLHLACLVGFLFMIATERSQRLGDLLAGTVVVLRGPEHEGKADRNSEPHRDSK